MFGGWAFLLNGNPFGGAREGSLLVRLGKGTTAGRWYRLISS